MEKFKIYYEIKNYKKDIRVFNSIFMENNKKIIYNNKIFSLKHKFLASLKDGKYFIISLIFLDLE